MNSTTERPSGRVSQGSVAAIHSQPPTTRGHSWALQLQPWLYLMDRGQRNDARPLTYNGLFAADVAVDVAITHKRIQHRYRYNTTTHDGPLRTLQHYSTHIALFALAVPGRMEAIPGDSLSDALSERMAVFHAGMTRAHVAQGATVTIDRPERFRLRTLVVGAKAISI